MSPALLALILQLVQLALSEIPELISAEETIRALLISGADPTPEQEAQINAAHDVVKAKLEAKLAMDLDTPPAA